MRRRHGRALFFFILIVGVVLLVAVWRTADRGSGGGAPAFGGVYVEGVIGTPARINPLFTAQNETDATLSSLIFAGLTRLDDKGQPFPDLADNWSLSQDGRTYTFVLRQGLIWQDGQPLTADDVIFTYGLLKDPNLRIPPAQARALDDATFAKVDASTVTVTLPKPSAALPAYLTLGLLPMHLLSNVPSGGLYDVSFNQQPVGAGPYKLEHLTPDRATLVANPSHPLSQPFVQRLELRFFRDEGSLLTAIKTRQVNGGLLRSTLSDSDQAYLDSRNDLRQTQLATGETAFLYFNLTDSLFKDQRVRQALLDALDRDALIKSVLAGQAVKADSPLPVDSWAYIPSLNRYHFDPAMAGSLLDAAGWHSVDNGPRQRNGQPLSFTLVTNTDSMRVAVAQAVAKAWQAVGAGVTVEAGGTTNLVRDLLEPRRYQVALFSQVADADPDPYYAWDSSEATGTGANISSLADGSIDKLLEDARGNKTPSQRKDLYGQFQELFAQQAPAIPLYASAGVYIQPAALQGVRLGLSTTPGDRFWQVEEWHLKTR